MRSVNTLPLPVTLLPLAEEILRRLRFLGLRTLGQYAAFSAPPDLAIRDERWQLVSLSAQMLVP